MQTVKRRGVLILMATAAAISCKTSSKSDASAELRSVASDDLGGNNYREVSPGVEVYSETDQMSAACQLPSPEYWGLTAAQKSAELMKLNAQSFTGKDGCGSAAACLQAVDVAAQTRKILKRDELLPAFSVLATPPNAIVGATFDFVCRPDGAKLMLPTFRRVCDVIDPNETEGKIPKRVHALGAVASAHFKVTNPASPYSGLLGSHGQTLPVVVRFSIANPVWTQGHKNLLVGPEQLNATNRLQFIPGIGVKFLFDGKKASEDLVAMESLAGQNSGTTPDRRYFLYDFTTNFTAHSPIDATGDTLKRYQADAGNHQVMKLVGQRFQEALNMMKSPEARAFWRSTTNIAAFTPDGKRAEALRAPRALIFRATAAAKAISASPYNDFREALATLPEGTPVFTVLGEEYADGGEATEVPIGEITLDSRPIASSWGDRALFFRHSVGAGPGGANNPDPTAGVATNTPAPTQCGAAAGTGNGASGALTRTVDGVPLECFEQGNSFRLRRSDGDGAPYSIADATYTDSMTRDQCTAALNNARNGLICVHGKRNNGSVNAWRVVSIADRTAIGNFSDFFKAFNHAHDDCFTAVTRSTDKQLCIWTYVPPKSFLSLPKDQAERIPWSDRKFHATVKSYGTALSQQDFENCLLDLE